MQDNTLLDKISYVTTTYNKPKFSKYFFLDRSNDRLLMNDRSVCFFFKLSILFHTCINFFTLSTLIQE